MTIELLEQRLEALEGKYVDLKHELDIVRGANSEKTHWIDDICGSMDNYPEWDEVVRLGREWRQNYRAPGDETE